MITMVTMITIRELSPGPQLLQRRAPSTAGSLASLRFIILIMTITFYPQGLHLMTIAMMTMTIHLSSSRSPFGSQQNLAGGPHHSRFDIFTINLHHHPHQSSSIFSHFFSTTSYYSRLRHGTRDAQWSADEGVLRMHLRSFH